MRHIRLVLTWFILLGALGGAATAQKASAADVEKAKQLYVSATKHFDLAEYTEALADYKEAYRLKDDPVFLYNIAQCYRKLNQYPEAVTFYKNYLRRQPDAPNADEVQGKIKTLEEAIATQERAKSQNPTGPLEPTGGDTTGNPDTGGHVDLTVHEPPPVAPAEHHTPLYKKWWLWTALGAVVVAGVVIGVAASSSSSPSGTTFPGVSF